MDPNIVFKKKKFLDVFIWLCWVLAAAVGIFSCDMRDLSCGMRGLSLWPGMESGPPALGGWQLNCWTPRKAAPSPCVFQLILHGFQLHFLYLFESKYCFIICYMLCTFNLKSPTSWVYPSGACRAAHWTPRTGHPWNDTRWPWWEGQGDGSRSHGDKNVLW